MSDQTISKSRLDRPKVGDILYAYYGYREGLTASVVIRVYAKSYQHQGWIDIAEDESEQDVMYRCMRGIIFMGTPIEDVGKLVFYTREDALANPITD